MFSELHQLRCIAYLLATAWPEQAFSTLCWVKTKQRNRLLDIALNGKCVIERIDQRIDRAQRPRCSNGNGEVSK